MYILAVVGEIERVVRLVAFSLACEVPVLGVLLPVSQCARCSHCAGREPYAQAHPHPMYHLPRYVLCVTVNWAARHRALSQPSQEVL